MDQSRSSINLAGPGIMLLSAAVFGFFGFMTNFPELTTDDPPKIIPLVVTLKWTLRGAAVAFFMCALLSMAQRSIANSLYAVVGLLSAIAFVVIALWDFNSPYMSGVHPFLLLVFAAWNGYGSWTSLREIMAARRITSAETPIV